jgi:hypothetical protein
MSATGYYDIVTDTNETLHRGFTLEARTGLQHRL